MAIAVDVMGGDYYPQMPVAGALQAVKEKGIKVILVGDEAVIKAELQGKSYDATKVEIHHASDIIPMEEAVATAMKRRDTSMRVCFNLHRDKLAQGVVSAGSSGAMLALGRFVLKMLPGFDRPCISALMPTIKDKILLVDAGANMDCTPLHLYQFAILGSIYMQFIHHRDNPRIGLLNIGSEPGKGDELSRETFDLLVASKLNFQGNVEGKQFFDGHLDVVVCDGFAGNVLLKSVQGAASYVKNLIKDEVKKSPLAMLGALLMKGAFEGVRKRSDYAEFGGAPLLGLNGSAIVCHGSSNAKALAFGINFAQWADEAHLVERMAEKSQEYRDILTINTTPPKAG